MATMDFTTKPLMLLCCIFSFRPPSSSRKCRRCAQVGQAIAWLPNQQPTISTSQASTNTILAMARNDKQENRSRKIIAITAVVQKTSVALHMSVCCRWLEARKHST
ncbi:hypothetical protein B0T16DRAFT_409898 [Cercophora newfieldiana]|uniref:Secreted protein n=1 Tax=Cercophora newfieldiana TaxID=92897 RepID=A0AA39YE64_9PEZI|nr:hypothetical protein B0T16DRAFT_409898 [Cercophora newfieldiana]